MFEYPSILLSLITLPLLGIFVVLLIPQNNPNLVKTVSLWTSLITFFISLVLWLQFDLSTPKYQFVEHFFSVPYVNMNVFIGVDGISLFFVLLTTFNPTLLIS
jgi:NADH:ubiquinone oxidoreductase subunit 4 (subunit M)